MPYFPDLNTYLHQSSLLIQAYPTTRISTRYSLPRKPKPNTKPTAAPTTADPTTTPATEKRAPSATLTLKTFHPESGICLKYQTDKAAEVGRLMTGLGKLAAGEVIEMPPAVPAGTVDGMEVDGTEAVEVATPKAEEAKAGGGGKGKKKKGKK